MGKYAVSIIIPVYNAEKTLEAAVNSVLVPERCFEIVLVDDGSSDGSAAICDSFEKKYDNVLALHKQNGGSMSARITGISVSSGEYIAFLDADDIYLENTADLFKDTINKYSPDIAIFNYDMECNNGAAVKTVKAFDGETDIIFDKQNKKDLYKAFLGGRINTLCACLYKRELLLKENRLEDLPKMKVGEDRLQKLCAIENAKKTVYVPVSCYFYKWYDTSQFSLVRSNGFSDDVYRDFCIAWQFEREGYTGYGLTPEECDFYDADKLRRILRLAESLLTDRSPRSEKKRSFEMFSNDSVFKTLYSGNVIALLSRYDKRTVKLLKANKMLSFEIYYRSLNFLRNIKSVFKRRKNA